MTATSFSKMATRALQVLALGLLGSCATKVAAPSGFIENADELKRDKTVSRPDFEYRSRRHLPVSGGTRIYVAPVVVRLRDSGGIDAAAQRRIAQSFTRALRTEIGKQLRVVSSRPESELEVRTVVTELKPSVPAINMATSIYPSTRISAELKQAVIGEQTFTGSASTEIEVRRRADGRRIYAMMDHTTARKAITTSTSSWAPVEKLCARWAADLAESIAGEVKFR